MAADKLRAAEQTKGLHTFFKLQTTISCDNMVLFDQNGCMKKYNDAGEILKDFYDLRFAFYGKRKQYLEGKRSILQTFWKTDCVTRSLFFELETPYFGSSFVFSSPLNLQGQILPNLTFWTQKWHISLKSRYHYSKIFASWDKCMTWNMRFLTFKCQVR